MTHKPALPTEAYTLPADPCHLDFPKTPGAKMDEADKYKLRLEAIAEKRRLQEEQDRVRREMEEERLRLQQLKRKSLRDQWLMEGAPLSPASPVSQSPQSPLWGAKAQEIEKHIDKLQAEHEQLAEEEEKMKEQMENGQTEVVNVEEVDAEQDDDVIVPNGGSNAGEPEAPEDKLKTNLSPLKDETAAVLTNGAGEVDVSECTQSSPSSLVLSSEDINTKLEDRPNVAVEEEEHAPISNASMCEEEEDEGTLVMRAERVIITDEGYDVNEDLVSQEDQLNALESEETPTPNPEEGQEEAVEEGVKPETAPEIFTQGENTEAMEPTAEEQPATAEEELQSCIDTNTDGQNKTLDPTCVQMQPLSTAPESAAVSALPIYGESTLAVELMPEGGAEVSPEGPPGTALKDQDPITVPGHFQEVPLADSQEKQSAEARPGEEEEEPLLLQTTVPNVQSVAGAAADASSSTETNSPTRAGQGDETQDPKRKTCQCCSVM